MREMQHSIRSTELKKKKHFNPLSLWVTQGSHFSLMLETGHGKLEGS